MTSGCRGTAYFPRRYDRELVFKTGDFSLKKKLGGGGGLGTVERLKTQEDYHTFQRRWL